VIYVFIAYLYAIRNVLCYYTTLQCSRERYVVVVLSTTQRDDNAGLCYSVIVRLPTFDHCPPTSSCMHISSSCCGVVMVSSASHSGRALLNEVCRRQLTTSPLCRCRQHVACVTTSSPHGSTTRPLAVDSRTTSHCACRPYNLYCVGGDVKPCSINQSISPCMDV